MTQQPTRVRRPRAPVLDAACAAAVDTARAAAEEVATPAAVGEHGGTAVDGDRVVTHRFACLLPGYAGWHWAVTVARASRARAVTVDEVVLLPGDGSLVAPAWVPWHERVQPGDLGVGDVLPAQADDPRLVPGYTGAADADDAGDPLRPPGWEPGLGRVRVLSAEGLADAAGRWHDGDTGPQSSMAKAAPARCSSCGFLLPVGGLLGQAFALCANEMSPADGRVVCLDFGCGAHSEAAAAGPGGPAVHVLDEIGWDALDLGHS